MEQKIIVGKIRKWGNSMGILVSKKDVEKLGLKEDQEIQIHIEPRSNPLKEMAGKLNFKRPAKEAIEEFRKNISKWG